MLTVTTLNMEFKFIFKPKDRSKYSNRKSFGIGGNKLADYIGRHNATVAVNRMLDCLEDSLIVRLRGTGTLYIYRK